MPAKLLKEDFLFYLKKNLEKVGLGRGGGDRSYGDSRAKQIAV